MAGANFVRGTKVLGVDGKAMKYHHKNLNTKT